MDFSNWKWLNESQCMSVNGELAILAPPKTDWFNDPVPEDGLLKVPVANAPFLYTEVTGELELKTVGNLRAGM